ncbi:hypothetical protein DSO57_1006303 [Entomophthora muscae]|uniref:Uncharacterized protein n=1 Tax=Entomophthora muscae TaxID=34485 RepID=A0ACC2T7F1_9FUNG|nr:hypothetical protein DSO57_1006303 [Entomophthora muscae]
MGSLSSSERIRFIEALQKLHQKSDVDDDSKYDGYARLHEANSRQAHGQPQFLPWHRQYIRNLEKDLQEIDPSVVLPYWDWSKDYEDPHDSYIFQSAFMGGNGVDRQSCVEDGPFKSWIMATPISHCLSRDFDGGDSISPFVSPRVISQLLRIRDFSKFSERLEVVHGAIHVNIGGTVGDLAPMWSPNE